MKQKVLYMTWLSRFQCIGGSCPLTCCSAKWNISLKDEEIACYENMEHPFRNELMDAIDKENHCMKTRNDVCALLTEDGWCRLVRECGEDKLSATCTGFPRSLVKYGDIIEGTVEIVCPVVAGYLLEAEPIDFGYTENEVEAEEDTIDYQRYDSLSLARTFLIELVQEDPYRFVSGKVYIIFSVMYKMKELIQENMLNKENVIRLLELYDKKEVRDEIYMQCENLAEQYATKGIFLQNLLIQLRSIIKEHLSEVINSDSKLSEQLGLWTSDAKELEKDLKEFSWYLKEAYPAITDHFLVYILFLNWITLDLEQFGQVLSSRMIEWALIQIFAMSLWKQNGKIEREEYEVLISSVDRKMSHAAKFYDELYRFIKELGKDNVANILMVLI